MRLARLSFWTSLAVCIWIYFGYPALLWLLARRRPRPVAAREFHPHVSVIVPAYNEERTIGQKIENTLSLDYPADRLEVLVMSNGSTDRTVEIARTFGDERVHVFDIREPGKIRALNEGAANAAGEILVFTDADFFLDRHSLKALTRNFTDPEVGGVCGSRRPGMTREGDATGEGEGLYARWDRQQKILESRIGSVFAADGLLYAIRKELYVPVLDPAQADDIAISAQIPLQGYRLLFEGEATAWEQARVDASEEFRRKIRVTGHSVAALLKLRSRLVTSGFYSVELLSHKLVRHFIPFFLISLFASNLKLSGRGLLYRLSLAGQLLVYGLAATGSLLRNTKLGRARPLYVPYYFCFVNAAALLGILRMLRGSRTAAWTSRGDPTHDEPR